MANERPKLSDSIWRARLQSVWPVWQPSGQANCCCCMQKGPSGPFCPAGELAVRLLWSELDAPDSSQQVEWRQINYFILLSAYDKVGSSLRGDVHRLSVEGEPKGGETKLRKRTGRKQDGRTTIQFGRLFHCSAVLRRRLRLSGGVSDCLGLSLSRILDCLRLSLSRVLDCLSAPVFLLQSGATFVALSPKLGPLGTTFLICNLSPKLIVA